MGYVDDFELSSQPAKVLTVSQLTGRIKDTLQGAFSSVRVVGELSDVTRPQSGHIYLTLKDERAQIRGVIWRTTAVGLDWDLKDGVEVICRGELDVYAPRGGYQLVIRRIEPVGVGTLQLRLRRLHKRLEAEGLFHPALKQPLPRFPRRIVIITSPTGAAIRDFLEVVARRWAGVHVLVIPVRVQGSGAELEIGRAIETASRLTDRPDVIVVARGGGSLEDLWCFNEEIVVRAIHACRIPIVSAIGHEIDVTLSDLAADVRALTPSEAAELVVPAADEVRATLQGFQQRLAAALRGNAARARARVDALGASPVLRRPFDRLHEWSRGLDDLGTRASRALQNRVNRAHDRLNGLAGKLESLSPLGVLARGYSLTQSAASGEPVINAEDVAVGDQILTRLAAGSLVSRITESRITERHSSDAADELAPGEFQRT